MVVNFHPYRHIVSRGNNFLTVVTLFIHDMWLLMAAIVYVSKNSNNVKSMHIMTGQVSSTEVKSHGKRSDRITWLGIFVNMDNKWGLRDLAGTSLVGMRRYFVLSHIVYLYLTLNMWPDPLVSGQGWTGCWLVMWCRINETLCKLAYTLRMSFLADSAIIRLRYLLHSCYCNTFNTKQ